MILKKPNLRMIVLAIIRPGLGLNNSTVVLINGLYYRKAFSGFNLQYFLTCLDPIYFLVSVFLGISLNVGTFQKC